MKDIRIGLGLADWRWIGRLAVDWGLIGDGLAMDWQIVSRLATDRQRIGDGLAMDWQVGNGLAGWQWIGRLMKGQRIGSELVGW